MRKPTHRRVVMLVDNRVEGDSRVQKAARSAAEAGWEVILLGRSPDRRRRSWRLGDARVRLLPVPTAVSAHQVRWAPLRRPLAYRPGPIAGYRRQQLKAWRAELRNRRALLRLERRRGASAASLLIRQGRLLAARTAFAAFRRWVSVRLSQTASLMAARKRLNRPLDRMALSFWRRAMGERCWRRLDPQLSAYEVAFGPVVDRLRPDLIHAHDFRMIGVGARAKLRAQAKARDVKLVWDVHEYLPGIKPWNDSPRWHPAQCAHEREFAACADAVVTVSETLADLLVRRHGLRERPAVVLNAPETPTARTGPGLREMCGVDAGTPLIVYSGAAAPQRGLDIMVEALPYLPDVHAALVVPRPAAAYVVGLERRAEELGVAGRLHVLPYVAYDEVVAFLSGADAGVIPIHRWQNHEIALITKFFEYAHARLPLVVSDVKTMAETVRRVGHGEVFPVGDLEGFVRAVLAVLSDPRRYRAAYDAPGLLDEWTWEAQAAKLDRLYRRLLPAAAERPACGEADLGRLAASPNGTT
ncbi:glycosyltransferase family 4 protein [Thermoactinospora rubra]|uniref:glycosyltransferase family 4 protein n=1 Tax=Thermoactinospora rubra TaxID=1088767 RepID=UPI00197EC63B|nr:glycosyltransferase family 4 protein [Thermoactinospora rubra]